MMTTIIRENLDERIERIKKRNEEIEKKYREAEEDRLMALKDNAMVEIKPPKDEDWPKAHKYDKLDFTYDVKPEKLEELNKQKKEEVKISKRDYKKFADGEGPPPDPAYNFLADAERDGIITPNKNEINKKDSRQNNNMNGNKNKDHQQQQQQQHKRGGPNNNSFRGRGNNKNHNGGKYQKQNSQPEYEQWRNEREKIDEARINRQKVGDGKWKREWDNDKINAENEALFRSEKITSNEANSKKIQNHNVAGKLNRQNLANNFKNATDCLVEKRGNITVSISQTGEVKSVKLTSAPAIGTGRVGPRQIMKPQFSIQTVEREVAVQQIPLSPRAQNKNLTKPNIISNNSTVNNQINLTQKVPNKTNGVANGDFEVALITPPNINSAKTKKDKKHSPKQLSNGNQKADSQLIKSITPQVSGNQLIQNVSSNNQENNVLKQKALQSNNLKTLQPINEPQLVSTSATSPSTAAVLPTPIFTDAVQSVSAPEIPIPIVDLSHKPEFQKRSIQDRLLRVRQANNTVSNGNAGIVAVTSTATAITSVINNTPSNPTKNELTNNEKDSNSIQSANKNEDKNDNLNDSVNNKKVEEKQIINEEKEKENCDQKIIENEIIPSTSSTSAFSAEGTVVVCN